ncbi:thioester-containing protein 1 allele R1 [Episyrphus balteatus]|uniref:thioester-containing protein 1 allele R1 n=1 Tax=Episyrphus balteatus TaxID=286459 RepID=UPI002486A9A7|nr:thioester-containing protein 1 allele R1 [Episyrphus balteatus]
MYRIAGLLFTFCLALVRIAPGNGQGYYSIIAPNTIRPNSQYHVAVTIHKSNEPATIKIGILSSKFTDFKTVEVRPYSSELVHFEIPDLKPDRYSLTAEGVVGITFTNETKLNFESRQFTVLIQTDKAIYKPGDIVHFRVLLLDSNLKPARNYGTVNLEIRDASGNLIKTTRNVRFTSSVLTDELQLSTFPVLGEWSINVEVHGDQHKQTFEIAEYILPKFEVAIDTAKHAIYKDGKITATVRSRYAFGKPIKGEATISVYPKFFGSLQPFVFDLITRKVVPIDGKAYVEFDIKEELKFKEDFERDILLEAVVEEETSGAKQNTTTVVNLFRDRYSIETIRIPKYYIPGVPFEVMVKIVRNDGSQLKDFSTDISAFLTNSYGGSEMYNKTNYTLDGNGVVKLKFTVPEEDHDAYHSVIVTYMDVSIDAGKIPRKQLNSKNFILAQIVTDRPMVNQEVNFIVKTNQPMQYFVYQIVGRGDILMSRSVDVPNTKYHAIKFLATFAMVPKAKLLVYMVVDGELIYDEQTIEFGQDLVNFVKIEAPYKAPPGQDIDITITTKPHSYIGLMAVDQNALNIRMGNDLTNNGVMSALEKYDLTDMRSTIGSPGKQSGVITMSNTHYVIGNDPQTTTSPTVTFNDDDKQSNIKKTDIGPAHKFEVNTRPPLAGPYAFSRIPKPFWSRPRVHVMQDVAHTWLFMNISSGNEGRTTIHKRLPSQMRSWVLTGFSLDPVTGLGLSKPPSNLQSFRDFYISTDLPYSVRKGEVLAVPFTVFNNMDRDLTVEVTLYNTAQEFDFPHLENKVEPAPKIELYNRRSIKVSARSDQSLSFIIRPKKVGHVIIKAVANAQVAGDTVEKTLLVEPAGATNRVNRGFLLDLSAKPKIMENITIDIPKNAIPESAMIEVSVVGDLVGSAIKNVENLIQLPVGCAEQTMVNFVPNIMVLRYLQRIRKLSPAIENKAKKFLEVGYQRELYYRHKNGAFSAFGVKESDSSTWLTAYVAKSFRQASIYTQIDESIIKAALDYLSKNQREDGSFKETGDVFAQLDDQNVSLTAFTVLAFMENSEAYPEYKNQIARALNYIARGLDSTTDTHSLAIGAYVLAIANHGAKGSFIQQLDSMSNVEDGKKWWNKTTPDGDKKSPWYNRTRSVNIEITSYAAMALLESNLIGDALPILKWLVDQRNMFGGFSSSIDTVVGLETLIKFSERTSSQGTNVQVVFNYGQGAETALNVNAENAIVLQSYQLPATVKNLTISATGRGAALAQVSYRYNTNVTGAWPRFILDPQVNRISHADYLHLSICTSFIPVEGGAERSNMAVMEVSLPSGFTVDLDTLPSLEANQRIRKVETKKRDTVVIVYFDYLDHREICPTLDAYKTYKVTKHFPAPVVIYDYYDNARKARMFYRAPKSSLCDICDGSNCDNFCEKAEQRQSRRLDDSDDASKRSGSSNVQQWLPQTMFSIVIVLILSRILQ